MGSTGKSYASLVLLLSGGAGLCIFVWGNSETGSLGYDRRGRGLVINTAHWTRLCEGALVLSQDMFIKLHVLQKMYWFNFLILDYLIFMEF